MQSLGMAVCGKFSVRCPLQPPSSMRLDTFAIQLPATLMAFGVLLLSRKMSINTIWKGTSKSVWRLGVGTPSLRQDSAQSKYPTMSTTLPLSTRPFAPSTPNPSPRVRLNYDGSNAVKCTMHLCTALTSSLDLRTRQSTPAPGPDPDPRANDALCRGRWWGKVFRARS